MLLALKVRRVQMVREEKMAQMVQLDILGTLGQQDILVLQENKVLKGILVQQVLLEQLVIRVRKESMVR